MGVRRWRRTKSIMSFPALHFPFAVKMVYTIVTISGEIDIASAPVLREQLFGLLRPHAGRIVIDLSWVTFCDASRLAVLVAVSRRAGLLGGVLRLAASAP
jgi:anti-sigma B factor antagonist